jgi:hypothetical protein
MFLLLLADACCFYDYRLQIGPTKGAPGRSHLGSMGRKTSTELRRSK